jgi:serine/threonine-protein kinase
MGISIGKQLGSYEITELLGVGGMGEVYRARDTQLKRDVAIKVLPDTFSTDPERLARFQREAEVLASLNHSNIAAVYGLEKSSDVTGIVLELVDGQTLAEMVTRGPIAVSEALPIARQIADALEAAHDKGVVHRDLKPANIKVTSAGKVKVLDFGLAKMLEPESVPTSLTASPTIGVQPTYAGMIVGTASYMSPEQARGKNVDRRTDIWAFGCVLYEMLTGKQAFESGETISDAIAAVLKNDVDWTVLPADTPPHVHTLLRRCLQKDALKRLPHIGIARIEIDEGASPPATGSVSTKATPGWKRVLPWIVAAAFAIAAAAGALMFRSLSSVSPTEPVTVSVELGADVSLATTETTPGDSLALSDDGTLLAFVGVKGQTSQLYIRRLNELKALPLPDTDNASHPFFSPDGKWIGFFTRGTLKKISVNGGPSVTLAEVINDRGGAWTADGRIIFSPSLNTVGLQQILESGGKKETVTTLAPDENTHRWPQVLPNAKAVLYTSRNAVRQQFDDANVVVQPLPGGTPRIVVRGGYHGRYVASGHLVYIHDGRLMAAPFNLDRLEVTGDSVPVLENVVSYSGTGGSQFAISARGTLVFLQGNSIGNDQPIEWLARGDTSTALQAMASNWSSPRFSSDGHRLAIDIMGNNRNIDIWVYDWIRDALNQLTFDPTDESSPVWTPDDRRIVFSSTRGGMVPNLYWQRADGGEVQRLTNSPNIQRPGSWHPSGKYFVFEEDSPLPGTGPDLMILPMEGDEKSGWKPGQPTPFLKTPAFERGPRYSRDGRWIAYFSSETGQNEVWVRPFPGPGGPWRISTGGDQPVWSRDRNELLYRARNNRIMVAPYSVEGNSFKTDKPRPWSGKSILPRNREWSFDIHPDGERLAVALPPGTLTETRQDKVVFIFNFFEELRRLAPAKR